MRLHNVYFLFELIMHFSNFLIYVILHFMLYSNFMMLK